MSVSHRLNALFKPRSIAIVGASTKSDSLGEFTTKQATFSGFKGAIWAVNPNYDEVLGIPCYPTLSALPEVPDHVILVVPNSRVEETLREAAVVGARSATIFASCYLPEDRDGNTLTQRIQAICAEYNILLCGGNCLGFLNLDDGIRSTWFPHKELAGGSIGLIAHSGSVFVTMTAMDPRLKFNYVVSAGQELTLTAADYLDFILEQPSTKCVGLFLETVRDPAAFRAALEKANERRIPVVALKVGRTQKSADLARTHSGAIAGNDAAYEALFEHYGVARVSTLDEFSATLQILAHADQLGSGQGIVAVHDSGGQRGMAIDLATDFDVPYADISPETIDILSKNLEYGLEPVNPLDIWGTGNNFDEIFLNCFNALLNDNDTALGILFSDIGCGGVMDRPWGELTLKVAKNSKKPVFIAQNLSRTPNPQWLQYLTDNGVPVIDGTENALKAARHALNYKAFLTIPAAPQQHDCDEDVVRKWRRILEEKSDFDEAKALLMFSEFGIGTPRFSLITSLAELLEAAGPLRFPVVLKTAAPGILHKSEVAGVKLNIRKVEDLAAAYEDLSTRLGGRAIVAEMSVPGTEFAIGMISDRQFGPLMMVASGGIFVEIFKDRRVAMPPLDRAAALRTIAQLKSRPLLDGVRGTAPGNIEAFAELVSRFSYMIARIGDLIEGIDANPVIVTPGGAMVVDGVVIPR